mgnify:FL=1
MEPKETQHRYREQYLEALFTATTDGIVVVDTEGVIVEVNDAFCSLLGYTRQKLLGRKISTIDALDSSEDVVLRMQRVAQTGGERFETRLKNRDNRIIEVDVSLSFVSGYGGRAVSFVRDITEQREAQKKLRASEARWQFALEGAGDGVWDWNAETGEVYFSRQWKAMLGYEEEEVENHISEWESRIHPEDRDRALQDLKDHLAGRTEVYRNEHRLRKKDGSYAWILDRGKVIERTDSGEPKRVIGTHTDTTERKRNEERIKELLTEKETLLREVHHRIKNDMNFVRSLLSLQANEAKSEEVRDSLDEASNRVSVMGRVYERLYRGGTFRRVQLNKLVEELVADLKSSSIPAGIPVETEIDELTISTRESVSIGIIVNELLTNSVKYAADHSAEPRVELALRESNKGKVTLLLRDNGPGLPERVLTKEELGYGLTIVSALVEQHDGTLAMRNEGGAVVEVTLTLDPET